MPLCCNYSKNFHKNRKKDNFSKKELLEYLLSVLPNPTLYAFNKNDLKFKRETTNREAIAKGNFLYYNTNYITELLFDIDNISHLTIWDLDWIYQTFYEKFSIPITWSCKTNKGVQFCISINTFYKLTKKQLKVLRDFKQYIIDNWALIDKNGSKRLKGWWRNPFNAKDFRYYGNRITFKEILDFLYRNNLDIKKQFKNNTIKRSIKNNIPLVKKQKFFIAGEPVKGNRNNWLWYNTMFYCNSKNFNKVFAIAKELNEKIPEPLEESEVKKIAKSVLSYNLEEPYKIKSKNKKQLKGNWIYGWKQKAEWNIGSMGFEKMRGLNYEKYLKEVKRRQSMAGKERGKKNLLARNEKLANETKEKVYKAINELKEKGEKVTIKKVETLANVSYTSARKYIKQAKEEGII